MDYVFRDRYSGILAHWALKEGMGSSSPISQRALTVCYDDLNDRTRVNATINEMFDFWYNGADHPKKMFWESGNSPLKTAVPAATVVSSATTHGMNTTNHAGHSTEKDPGTTERLLDVINRLDGIYYNGDVAWLASVLPCQKRRGV